MLHGRLVGNWSSCWSSMRHCGSWCRHKPATRLKSMQLFCVVNSTLTLSKLPSGKNMKKTEMPETLKAFFKLLVEWVASPLSWTGNSHNTGIYPLSPFFWYRTRAGSLSFPSFACQHIDISYPEVWELAIEGVKSLSSQRKKWQIRYAITRSLAYRNRFLEQPPEIPMTHSHWTLTCVAKIRRAWKCEVWPFLRHVILLRSPPGAPATIIQDGILLMPPDARLLVAFWCVVWGFRARHVFEDSFLDSPSLRK